jgi:FKBP-type peptidyl-prolyl cis-trans isomerase 2
MTLPDGISKRIISENPEQFDGKPTPKPHSTVSIHYTACLHETGTLFESSSIAFGESQPSNEAKKPVRITLGRQQCISGLELAVQTMRCGELAEFVFEPQHAYGADGGGERVPPNAVVRFVVLLVDWDDRIDVSAHGDGSVLKTISANSSNSAMMKNSAEQEEDHVKIDGRVRIAYKAYAGASEEPFETHTALEFIVGDDAVWVALERCVLNLVQGETALFECHVLPHLFEEFPVEDTGFLQRARTTPPTATVRFEVSMLAFQNMPSPYECQSPIERLEIAAFFKARGTTLFQRGRIARASQVFCAGVPYARGDGLKNDIETAAMDKKALVQVTAESNSLYIALLLNESACALKLRDWDDLRRTCDEVLKRDRTNLKAHLRLAAMYVEREELDEAEHCCAQVSAEAQQSNDIAAMRRRIADARQEANKRQRALFAGKLF